MKREHPAFKTSPPGEVLLATDSLLKIDVEAELRKLAGAQLHAAWQLPTELLRLCMAGGARSVALQLRGDRLEIEAPGWRCSGRTLQALSLLFGSRSDLDVVHSSLLALEGDESLGWIALTTIPGVSLNLVVDTEDGFYSLRASARSSELRPHAPPAPRAARLVVEGLALEQRRALTYLRESSRFASLPIQINGRSPEAPFKDAIDVAALSDGMRGAMALTRKGQAPRVWLTRHGVLAAHFTAPRGPGIELVVEVGRELSTQATAADLRERGEADLTPAMAQLAKRLAWLSGQKLPPADRRRLCELAIECAATGGDARELLKLPLLDRRHADGRLSPWSLLELRAQLSGDPGQRHCFALRPEDDHGDFDLSTPVVVLDDRLRAALARQLGIDFRPPPVQDDQEGFWSRFARRLRARWTESLEPLRRSRYAKQVVAPDELSPEEAALLETLRKRVAAEVRVAICHGDFASRASARALWLGREHPLVRAAASACARDEAWAYPSLLALAGGHIDATRARQSWSPTRRANAG